MKRISLSRNVLFGFLSWLLPLGFTVLLTPLIVHGLGAEAYGLYALVMGFVAYSFTFNVGRAITKYVAAYRASAQHERLGEVLSTTLLINLVVGTLSAIALALCSNLLVTRVLNIAPQFQATARLAFYFASVGLLVTMLSQVFNAVPQAVHRFDVYSLIATGTGMAIIGGNALLVWLGFGLTSLVAWNVMATGLSCAAYFIAARRLLPEARLAFRFKRDLLMGILRFSGAVIAYQVLANLLLLFERGYLTRTLGSAAVTFYVVPMTISIYIHAFVSSLTLVIFPLASEAGAQRDTARLHTIYTRAYKYISMLVLFLVVTLALGSYQLLSNWMGEEFARNSARVLMLQAVVFGLIAWGVVAWQIADGLGHPGRNAMLVLVWMIIAVPLMIWLTPLYGIVGTAYGRLASALTVPFYILLTERLIFGKCLWRFWLRTGLILSLGGMVMAALQLFLFHRLPHGWHWLILSVAASGALYFGLLWAVGFLDRDERAWLKNFASRVGALFRAEDLSGGM
ncbi:MAG: polysaccharide biosynthesis protein [Acidobacteria bacterium]|nr:polysaccharide biosynthesis protein [Acidobacteriota bacterium]